jgi:hypothetical protein
MGAGAIVVRQSDEGAQVFPRSEALWAEASREVLGTAVPKGFANAALSTAAGQPSQPWLAGHLKLPEVGAADQPSIGKDQDNSSCPGAKLRLVCSGLRLTCGRA